MSVPPSARQDPRIQALTKRYVGCVAALTLVSALVTALAMARLVAPASGLVVAVAILVLPTCGFALMLWTRAQVRALKEQEGWTATAQRAAAVVGDGQLPRPIPLAWELLHLVIVVALAATAFATYDRLPEMVPLQIELDGSVSEYARRSLGVALYPVAIASFMGIVFAASHAMILRSKRPIDPAAPATSAYAYGRFARLQSLIMLVGGLALNACIGVTYFASALGGISTLDAAVAVTAAALVFVVVELWAALYQGQSGARLAAELRTSDELARDDDAFWKLGSFYVNRDDPAVVVPKRFGVGWTINLARPVAWALLGGLVVLTAAFCLAAKAMVG